MYLNVVYAHMLHCMIKLRPDLEMRKIGPAGGAKNFTTGRERLIRSHSSTRFCFELSGNSNLITPCNSNFDQNFELEISLN